MDKVEKPGDSVIHHRQNPPDSLNDVVRINHATVPGKNYMKEIRGTDKNRGPVCVCVER
jgi:hypothetical protein